MSGFHSGDDDPRGLALDGTTGYVVDSNNAGTSDGIDYIYQWQTDVSEGEQVLLSDAAPFALSSVVIRNGELIVADDGGLTSTNGGLYTVQDLSGTPLLQPMSVTGSFLNPGALEVDPLGGLAW